MQGEATMAFKPLEFFRKRQKLFLAFLTLVAMALFIVGDAVGMRSSGGSSLGQKIGRWFSSKEAVATVAGQALDQQDLEELAYERISQTRFLAFVSVNGNGLFYRAVGFTADDVTSRE